jgi:hypothetical protein
MCQICNNKVLLIETPPPHLNGVDYVNWYTPNQIRPITNDCKDCCATTYYYFAMVVYKTSSLHIYPISESIHWPRPTAGLLRTAVLTGRQKTWKLKPVRTYPLHRNLCHTQTHTKKERGKNDLLLLRRTRSNSTKIYAHSHCYYYEPTGRRKIIKKKNIVRIGCQRSSSRQNSSFSPFVYCSLADLDSSHFLFYYFDSLPTSFDLAFRYKTPPNAVLLQSMLGCSISLVLAHPFSSQC